MRVTQSMAMRDFLRDIQGAQAKMLDAQNKVSTGRAILRPSDDPRGMSDILRLTQERSCAISEKPGIWEVAA